MAKQPRHSLSVPAEVHTALVRLAHRRGISTANALELVCGMPLSKRAEVEETKVLWVSAGMFAALGTDRVVRKWRLERAIEKALDEAGVK